MSIIFKQNRELVGGANQVLIYEKYGLGVFNDVSKLVSIIRVRPLLRLGILRYNESAE
jgi:hypothetical protein